MADRIVSTDGTSSVIATGNNILMDTLDFHVNLNEDSLWVMHHIPGNPEGDTATGLKIDDDGGVVLGIFENGATFPRTRMGVGGSTLDGGIRSVGSIAAEEVWIGNSGTDVGGTGSRKDITNPDDSTQSLNAVSTGNFNVRDYLDDTTKRTNTTNFSYLSEYSVGGYYDVGGQNAIHGSNVNQAGIIDLGRSYVNEDLVTDYTIGSNNPTATGARTNWGTFRSLGYRDPDDYHPYTPGRDSWDSYQIISNTGDWADYRDRDYGTTNVDGLHAAHVTRGHDVGEATTYTPFMATVDSHITTKKYVDDRMIVSTTEPTEGSVGQQWFNPTTGHLHIYTE